MPIHSITQARNLVGKRVLLRVDFNVPIKKGKVLDDSRIIAALPTIQFLLQQQAKIIIMTHLGRPKGKVVSELRVAPIVIHLTKLLKKKIEKLPVSTGSKVEAAISKMKPGGILFLENIQFEPGETARDPKLAATLASYADCYVTDNFAQAHRDYASISLVPRYLPSYAGFLLGAEINGLNRVLQKPKHPFVVVLGGAKIETKIPIMKNLLAKADHILIGGGLLNTYLAGKGYGVGDSLVDHDFIKEALKYCAHTKVVRPVDVMVGTNDGKNFRVVTILKKPHTLCEKGEGIYDMGTNTVPLFQKYIREARTLVWNGAMGYFEQEPYNAGTKAVAELVAGQSKKKTCFGVIGGGETVQSVEALGLAGDIDLVSTGGGAMLEFLAGEKLPGTEALKR